MILGSLYFKGIGAISSMQDMTRAFNKDSTVSTIYNYLNCRKKEYLPHHVTVNEYFERLKPFELEKIQQDIVYKMVRRKTFDSAKVQKKCLVIEDVPLMQESVCLAGEVTMHISPDGAIFPCAYVMGQDEFVFGDVRKRILAEKVEWLRIIIVLRLYAKLYLSLKSNKSERPTIKSQ